MQEGSCRKDKLRKDKRRKPKEKETKINGKLRRERGMET
jgi:hypothetical protein